MNKKNPKYHDVYNVGVGNNYVDSAHALGFKFTIQFFLFEEVISFFFFLIYEIRSSKFIFFYYYYYFFFFFFNKTYITGTKQKKEY